MLVLHGSSPKVQKTARSQGGRRATDRLRGGLALLTRLAHAHYSACLPLRPFPERDPGRATSRREIQPEGVLVLVAEVKVQDGESIESALRRFKRKVQQEDIIKDIKKHSFYLKPGDKRRAKQALARKRSRKKQRRDLD